MTKNRYSLVSYFREPRGDDGWEAIENSKIQWLLKQDKTKYIVEEMFAYEYDNAGIPIRASVYVTFYDEKLETEYLLKFSHLMD
jgi:hypothetical protein